MRAGQGREKPRRETGSSSPVDRNRNAWLLKKNHNKCFGRHTGILEQLWRAQMLLFLPARSVIDTPPPSSPCLCCVTVLELSSWNRSVP